MITSLNRLQEIHVQFKNTVFVIQNGGVGFLQSINNLSDVSNIETARTNLDVYSTTEVNTQTQYKESLTVGANNADFLTGDYDSDDLAIQAALDQANTNGGGFVTLLDNTYTLNAGITIPNSVTLQGYWNGYFSTNSLLTTNNPIHIVTFNTTQTGGIQNIRIDGNSKTALSGIRFLKDALPKIKATLIRDVFVTQCQTGIDAASTGIASGPFDDTIWTNIRIANCDVGIDWWNVFGGIDGGSIGGCQIGIYCRTASALALDKFIFSQNVVDFSLDDQNPFSYRIANCYFEGTSEAHISRNGVTTTSSLGAFNFFGCTFLNTINTRLAFDFTYATGWVSFYNCRVSNTSPNSHRIGTNSNTFVTWSVGQTSLEPLISGSGRFIEISENISGVDTISSLGDITSGSMRANGGGFFGKSGNTNIVSLLRQASPSNASAIITTLGGFGIKTGTSTPETSAAAMDMYIDTSGNIIMPNLPTSSAGLPTGALWNDSGTLKIA